jgi:hypothetical protein
VSAQEYVEAIARELSRLRGRGLLMSPADSALALAWHAQGVPLARVLVVLREQGPRLVPRASRRGQGQPGPNGSAPPQISLQLFATALAPRRAAHTPGAAAISLSAELMQAARVQDLPARAHWMALALRADDLLAGEPQEQRDYWSLALQALKTALRELGRDAALQAGAALRERLAPRPPHMARKRYRRSLQLQLLSAASDRLGVPPRAFLL